MTALKKFRGSQSSRCSSPLRPLLAIGQVALILGELFLAGCNGGRPGDQANVNADNAAGSQSTGQPATPEAIRELAETDIRNTRDVAQRVAAAMKERLFGLATKDTPSAVRDGLQAVMRDWKQQTRAIAAPINEAAFAKNLPADGSTGHLKETVLEAGNDFSRATKEAVTQFEETARSWSASVDSAFGGVADNGKPYSTRPDQRLEQLQTTCTAVTESLERATSRIAEVRTQAIQKITKALDKHEAQASQDANAASLLASLEKNLNDTMGRWTRDSNTMVERAKADLADGESQTDGTRSQTQTIMATLAAEVAAQTRSLEDERAEKTRNFKDAWQRGHGEQVLSGLRDSISSDMSSRVDAALAKVRVLCAANKQPDAERGDSTKIAKALPPSEQEAPMPAKRQAELPVTEIGTVDLDRSRRNSVPSWADSESLNDLVTNSGLDFRSYVGFGSPDVAAKAQGDRFDRLEAEETAKDHRAKLSQSSFLWTAPTFRCLDEDVPSRTPGTIKQIILVDLPFRVADHPRVSLGPDVSIWDGGMGFAFLTKDLTLREISTPQELRIAQDNNGILYVPDNDTSQIHVCLSGPLDVIRSLVRESKNYVVQFQVSRLRIAKPEEWGYYRKDEIDAAKWHAPSIRDHETHRRIAASKGNLAPDAPPVYFCTQKHPNTPEVCEGVITRIEVARINEHNRDVIFTVDATRPNK